MTTDHPLRDIFKEKDSFRTSAAGSNFLYGAGQLLIEKEWLKSSRTREPMDVMLVELLAKDLQLCEKVAALLNYCAWHLFQAVYSTSLSYGIRIFMQEHASSDRANKRRTVSEHALDGLKRLSNHRRVPVDQPDMAMSVTLALQVLGCSIGKFFRYDGVQYLPDNREDLAQVTLIRACKFARQFPDLSEAEISFCMTIVTRASSVLLSEYELVTGG